MPPVILIDTSVLVAFYNLNDRYHTQSRQLSMVECMDFSLTRFFTLSGLIPATAYIDSWQLI
jgi:predicted nucleic acid-binding protein